tara:strand:- start:168 stop:416 length:249 start_codon:yes stop_codon:yes gene_type:complete
MGEIDPITGAPLALPTQAPVLPTPLDPAINMNQLTQQDPYNMVNPKAFNTQVVNSMFGMPNQGTFTRTVGDPQLKDNTNYTR